MEQQQPSGRRPEGFCHSIRCSVSARRLRELHLSCTVVPLLRQRDARLRPLLDVAPALDAPEGYVHHQDAADFAATTLEVVPAKLWFLTTVVEQCVTDYLKWHTQKRFKERTPSETPLFAVMLFN